MKNNFRNSESGRIIAGIILVGVGGVLLLRELGFFFPRWLFSWPMILILIGVYTGVKNNFRNNSWIIMLAIGTFFLVNKMIPSLQLQPAAAELQSTGNGQGRRIPPVAGPRHGHSYRDGHWHWYRNPDNFYGHPG